MFSTQYRKLRPSDEEFKANRARALLRFASRAILDGVHDRRRKWTWAYFAERRDDRNKYVELFEKKTMNSLRESVRFVLFHAMKRTITLFRTLRCSTHWNVSCHMRTSASTGRLLVPVYERTWSKGKGLRKTVLHNSNNSLVVGYPGCGAPRQISRKTTPLLEVK